MQALVSSLSASDCLVDLFMMLRRWAYKCVLAVLHSFLILAQNRECVANFTPRPHYPPGEITVIHNEAFAPAGIRTPDRPVRSVVVTPTALLRLSCVLTSTSRSVSFVDVLLVEKHNGSSISTPQALEEERPLTAYPGRLIA